VNLIVYDDRMNPQEAVAIANKLIEKIKSSAWSVFLQRPHPRHGPDFQKAGIPMVAGYAVHPM